MTVRVVTDSTCDLPLEIIERYGIRVIPLYINIEEKGYLDGVDLTREQFYQKLPAYDPPPTTATPGVDVFKKAYDELAAGGADEVLSIHISISLSATSESAHRAAEITTSVPVTVFDSRQLSLGTGFLVERAAQAAAEGMNVAHILPLLEEQISRTHVFAALDTLEFLRRSGRMNGALAGIGSLLKIKPLLKMYDGNPTSERKRTRDGAYHRLLALLDETMPIERIALLHTHAEPAARELLRRVQGVLPAGPILAVDITPVIGAHIGPGAVGFAVISAPKNRTA